jgi:hypothetical protein
VEPQFFKRDKAWRAPSDGLLEIHRDHMIGVVFSEEQRLSIKLREGEELCLDVSH